MLPHHSSFLSLAMHRPDSTHRLCLKKKLSLPAAIYHCRPIINGNSLYSTLTHSPSHFLCLAVVSGQTPLLLFNDGARCPLVLQAAERLLVRTFSQRAGGDLHPELFPDVKEVGLGFHLSQAHADISNVNADGVPHLSIYLLSHSQGHLHQRTHSLQVI